MNALRLERQLASESQMAELLANKGKAMAGAGMRRVSIVARLASELVGLRD